VTITVATARNSSRETEIKIAVRSAVAARRLLRGAQFRVMQPRAFESNMVWDTLGLRLRKSGSLLRVRETAGRVILTYKGPARAVRHKSREELEVEASDSALLQRIFQRLGFRVVFRYEKYRSEYRGHGAGIVTLDETPIGVYLELEGPPRWIDQTARGLGFAEKDYITASYGSLYLEWCREHSIKPGNMVF
jgi:adenylate cyclase, class 2